MKPVDTLLRSAARWLLVVLPIGVWLRSAFVWLYNPGPFTWGNLIHAHSHTAYFGWAGLSVMGLILHVLPDLTDRPLQVPRQLRWLLWLAPWAVGGALATFALWGYNTPSIAFSTLNEVVWFLFAYVFWQNVKGRPIREWPAALWLIGTAVALLLVSTLGTFLVIIAQAILRTQDPVLANSGIYLFLQAYGDGWLEVGVMGVAAAMMGGMPNRRLAAWQAWLMLILTAPATLRLLVPFGLHGLLAAVGAATGIGLAAAQLLYLVNMRGLVMAVPARVRPWWWTAGAALAVKAVLELLPLMPSYATLAGDRNLVIAFLHLKLLLLVSGGVVGALAVLGRAGRRGFWFFAPGAAVMILALVVLGFFGAGRPAFSHQMYAVAFWSALVAATGLYLAIVPVAA